MPQKFTPEIILAAIAGFELQKVQIDSQIADLRSILTGDHTESTATPSATDKPKRKFSAATRRKMAASQKARYAKLKHGSEPTKETAKPKRKMSASARKRIGAAQKARWAAIKKASEPELAVAKKAGRKKTTAQEAA